MFFQPEAAWVGDVIPWQEDGVFQLFYLFEGRQGRASGMPWHRVATSDLTTFVEHGEALPSGGPAALDHNVYTGSIVRDAEGLYHAFYTGQNPDHLGEDGHPLQLVMHATTSDLAGAWRRHDDRVLAPPPGYVTSDWRDPFVFWDDARDMWRMLVTARHDRGPQRRSGVIAQCVSTDLWSWEPVAPFWDPGRYLAMECPEVFRWGDWWYLVYSEFSDAFVTRYRMARSLDGPWIVPELDTLDGRAYYAAKSAERDGRRFFFGWIASREGERDDGPWQWAGTLSVLEAEQRPDGTLRFHPPAEVRAAFPVPLAVTFQGADPAGRTLADPEGYQVIVSDQTLPDAFRVEVGLDIAERTTECGLVLRTDADGDQGFAVRLEPRRHRLVVDRWPRRSTGGEQWQISGDVPFAVELERPCPLAPGEHRLAVIVDGTICVISLDDTVVLSTRLYDRPPGRLGMFVGEGTATVRDLVLHVPGDPTAPDDPPPSRPTCVHRPPSMEMPT